MRFVSGIVSAVAAIAGLLTLLVAYSPTAIYAGLVPWSSQLTVVGALLLAVGIFLAGRMIGLREAAAAAKGLPVAAPEQVSASPRAMGIPELLYAARSLCHVLQAADFRDEAAKLHIIELERAHWAWYEVASLNARNHFLDVARAARSARELRGRNVWMAGPGPHYGDFPDGSRVKWTADIEAAAGALIAALENQHVANLVSLDSV
ncbi:hypothetical protein [Sphingomonas asaccharolytica]|uniref:hypothetical protein n=1 Tax=Sphingomonas asaccharolytica TaxID=40681 RepID=UPI0008331950|nr:hypothetical protein [Sphingomonas asaccharolytica]